MNIKCLLDERRNKINDFISNYQFVQADSIPKLREACNYSLSSPGKRLRPILTTFGAEFSGGSEKNAIAIGSAIEFIHTYSLIHDDLPCMDNDDYRRGRLTNHKAFGESLALLAGDALLTEAFFLLSSKQITLPSEKKLEIINMIALNSGFSGMVGGQTLDTLSTSENKELSLIKNIHSRKTGKLITASILAGIMTGSYDNNTLEIFSTFGNLIGLAFQIKDDLLDFESFEETGKDYKSDIKNNKMSFPILLGAEKSKEIAANCIKEAKELITRFGEKSNLFNLVADFFLERKK